MLNPQIKDAGLEYGYAIVLMEKMADRIRQLREAKGMTQPQLAKLTGVTKSAVSQREDGATANIKLEPFLRLCDALGTDPHYLVWGADRIPANPLPTAGRSRKSG